MPERRNPSEKVKILVVDDHRANTLALQATLADPTCEVFMATSGADALGLILKHEFAVILLDVVMPKMDGLDTARIIRRRDASKDIPIIFLTANGTEVGLNRKAYALGAVDFMIKPLDTEVVKAKVSVFVDLFRKTQQICLQQEQLRQAERRQAEEGQRFLAAASEALLSSLQYRDTLAAVARLAVPRLGDFCMVEVAAGESDGGSDFTIAQVDPEKGAQAEELFRKLSVDRKHGIGTVMRTRKSELISELVGQPPSALLRAMGLTSVMTVPMTVRDRILGAITFAIAAPRQAHSESDLAIAEDLAHRAAFAIDNARLYRQAQDAIRARDEFLSIASHELRTPLTPLQLQLQRMVKQLEKESGLNGSSDGMKIALKRSERQVLRLTALVENLLDVSRITSGHLRIQPEWVDLVEVLRDVVGRFAEELGRAGCEVDLDAGESVVGQWDRLRIEQVVTNLIANAIKYGSGKPIEIRLLKNGRTAGFSVRDNGIGIAPEQQTRIFGRFERAVSTRAYGGLGLGLYIAQQILDAHGGHIRVESVPNQGARFIVELPLQPETVERPPSSALA
jgi:signal transduction histidine kinase/DNA-binding response OmpR family regulator